MTDVRKYPAIVFWSDDDECFIAVAPDLSGCTSAGDSADEALRELHSVKEAWVMAQQQAGNPLPDVSIFSKEKEHDQALEALLDAVGEITDWLEYSPITEAQLLPDLKTLNSSYHRFLIARKRHRNLT